MERLKTEKILSIVKEYENGKSVKKISEENGVSVSGIYKWLKHYSNVNTTAKDRLKELEEENRKLQAENENLALDLKLAKEALEKKP
ncbi:hypothetical protein DXT99_04940 [Pontibacter diazotrophicus]|uniref:Transposase n=1 Tax=Pontibacter diazotrophicus TaxID=1400979 RepID=A0A3D8LGH6_9BACT|nr:transposase [Pontibacter diazotrophicus]RDV16541.1 hypothetical protein DXT99_04940 [Pontibacter diazotrophicus]